MRIICIWSKTKWKRGETIWSCPYGGVCLYNATVYSGTTVLLCSLWSRAPECNSVRQTSFAQHDWPFSLSDVNMITSKPLPGCQLETRGSCCGKILKCYLEPLAEFSLRGGKLKMTHRSCFLHISAESKSFYIQIQVAGSFIFLEKRFLNFFDTWPVKINS